MCMWWEPPRGSSTIGRRSRQDSQYTDKGKGSTANPAYDSTVLGSQRYLDSIPGPTLQITSNLRVMNAMPETGDAKSQAKLDALINFHRQRGARLQEALRTLPDGGWVNCDALVPYGVGSGCGGGAWRQLGRTFDVRPWASRSRSFSRSLCPSRARTLPRRRRTNPASEAISEPRTRQLGVARALRRLPTRLGVSNPAPTCGGGLLAGFRDADPSAGRSGASE